MHYSVVNWAGNKPSDTPKHRNPAKRKISVSGKVLVPRLMDDPDALDVALSIIRAANPGVWVGGMFWNPAPDFVKLALPSIAAGCWGRRLSAPRITYDVSVYMYPESMLPDVAFRNLTSAEFDSVMKVWNCYGHQVMINQNRWCRCAYCLRELPASSMVWDRWMRGIGDVSMCQDCERGYFGYGKQ